MPYTLWDIITHLVYGAFLAVLAIIASISQPIILALYIGTVSLWLFVDTGIGVYKYCKERKDTQLKK